MIDWSRIKKLFWNPPVEKDPALPRITGRDVGIHIRLTCGLRLWDGKSNSRYLCGKPSCPECNPMTPELAAQINERFLKERGYE